MRTGVPHFVLRGHNSPKQSSHIHHKYIHINTLRNIKCITTNCYRIRRVTGHVRVWCSIPHITHFLLIYKCQPHFLFLLFKQRTHWRLSHKRNNGKVVTIIK
jgi:hypothetical protein